MFEIHLRYHVHGRRRLLSVLPLPVCVNFETLSICRVRFIFLHRLAFSQQDNTDTALPVALWVLVDIVQTPTQRIEITD